MDHCRRTHTTGHTGGTGIVTSLTLLIVCTAVNCARPRQSLVNFRHLDHLTESIVLGGDSVDIVHVYANYPDYHWQHAADTGLEGVACVDDAARAAIVMLRDYEVNHNAQSLVRARRLLRFVLKMQSGDGEFYNFVLSDGSINTEGKTSFKSFGWWAARGVWSIGTGYRVFRGADPAFAEVLRSAFLRSFPHVRSLLSGYGRTGVREGYRVPRWLPYESGADVTSELTVGLIEYYSAEPDTAVRNAIVKLLDGVMVMQDGSVREYPYGLHRSWETLWHMWGNSQTQALAMAGRILRDSAMVGSAGREAAGFYSRLLIDGPIKECDVAKPGSALRYEQIAYAIRPMAVGLLRLYDATGNRAYLVMAGLAGSWLLGNNVLGRPMYDGSTGRCYDGIRDSVTANLNSGAESTVEALYTLIETEQYPEAARYLRAARVSVRRTARYQTAYFKTEEGDEATVGVDLQTGRLVVLTGEQSADFQKALRP